MYEHNSLLIVLLLVIGLIAAIEIGYHIGKRIAAGASEPTKTQVNAIQASLLGVLALLLGFTFSLALQRFDSRSAAVVSEANAIGTAMLRAGLLPDSVREQVQAGLTDYVELRIAAGTISLDLSDERTEALRSTLTLQQSLWELAERAAREAPNPVESGLFIQALNEMIDAYGARNAALNRHVPEVVLFLLFGTFALTAALVGYSSGVSGHRATFATYILVVLISFLVFIIIDLDRPRRGLIEVSQQSLLELRR